MNLLGSFALDKELVPLYRKQLQDTFREMNKSNVEEKRLIKGKLTVVKQKLEDLNDLWIDGKIKQKYYDQKLQKLEEEISMYEEEIRKREKGLSNLDEYIEVSLLIAENPSVLWEFADYEERQIMQKTFFPEKIVYDKKNHQYRTPKVNSFLSVTNSFSPFKNEQKKGRTGKKSDSSVLVVSASELSNLFIADFGKIADLYHVPSIRQKTLKVLSTL